MTATAHLTDVEECIYSRMVDQYYARELPLPLDLVVCCRLVRAVSSAARKAVAANLGEFFTEALDGWHQKRCDEELALYRERSASASASAQARWSKRNANAMRTHMPTQCEGNANHKPVTSNQVKTTTPARKRATSIPPGFAVSEQVRTWAAEKGYGQLDAHLEAFVGRAKAKGYRYEDWDQALQNSIREDWPKLRTSAGRVESLTERRVANMADITGRNRERTINASAVDRAPVRPALGDLRESDDSDVG